MRPACLTVAAAPFEAARSVPVLPAGHRSLGLHGHGFQAAVYADLPPGWAEFPGAEVASLQRALQAAIAPLDYAHLNTVLAVPTDENLARWVRQRLHEAPGVPGIDRVAIQSTAHQGVDLDRHGHAHVWRRYRFQAAHRLPNVPLGHKCGRLHGHGFEAIVHANQDLGDADLAVDYDHLDALWAPLHARLNYRCLNDIPGLDNPTSEQLSAWLWAQLQPQLPTLSGVTVYETASCGANFDVRDFRIWKDFTLDSAVQLKRAPAGSPAGAVHGHTYTLRLHLNAPLDAVLGWTLDFGDVKALFDPLFKRLDHHPLHELSGLDDSDAASIAAHWPQPAHAHRLVVLTGGEPLLQLDAALIDALHAQGFRIAVESNGTLAAPPGIDWLCVSPKAGAPLVQRSGHELKLVFPQPGVNLDALAALDFQRFCLQPMDGPLQRRNTELAIAFCQAHPQWGLSLQTHKFTGIR